MSEHIIGWLYIVGYVAVTSCYAPQWIKALRTWDISGLSPLFIGLAVFGLACIQIAVTWQGITEIMWGNGAALINALILAGAYVRIRRGLSRVYLPTGKGDSDEA